MMPKRSLSIILLATFVWMIGGPILAAAVEPPNEVFFSMHHEEGLPCHHDNHDNHDRKDHEPCEDECPWFWCPGHASVLYTFTIAYSATLCLKPEFCFDLYDFVLLAGIHSRVFRPPRA